ncbi:MAG: diacylglycerol kinase family protein [Cyclobacteriaceae bacterium]
MKKLLLRFTHALSGVKSLLVEDRNIRIHVFFTLIVVIVASWLETSYVEWALLIGCMGSDISLEIVNSAIEKFCDFVHPSYNHSIGKIKDYSAGAVLIASTTSLIIGLIIFIPHIKGLVK